MNSDLKSFSSFNDKAKLISGMREAYSQGENAMEFARSFGSRNKGDKIYNEKLSTLIAYDLQSGNYVEKAKKFAEFNKKYGDLHARLIEEFLPENGTLLEVGVGEATTLTSVIKSLKVKPKKCLGFDISWSRIKVANQWLFDNSEKAELFVGDMFDIPLSDNSIDVVFSSHSLEPNGGNEERLMRECYRVAKKAVLFIEPIYELASKEAKRRMRKHCYISGILNIAKRNNYEIVNYKLLENVDNYINPLNPTGILSIKKTDYKKDSITSEKVNDNIKWQCPLTKSHLAKLDDAFYSKDAGLAYPILSGIPLLRSEHAVIASLYELIN